MLNKTIRTFVSVFLLSFLILLTSTASYSDVIIDNGGAGTSYSGSWSLSGGTNPYGASSLWSRNGATYTFSMNGQQAGTYEVLMWWSGWSTRPTSVPIAVNHASGTQNLTINQLQNAGQWNSLGTFYFNGSGSVTITAANDDTLSTCADAVQFRYIPDSSQEVIIDNTSSDTSRTGTWTASSASGSYGTGSVWSRDGATFTWKFTPTQTGNYNVSMWWTTTPSRSSSIPVQINNGNGSQTVAVNQLQNAGQWNSLGTFSFVAGATYNIIMTSQPSPTSTCADAMKFTMVSSGPTAVIDSITPNPTNLGQTVTFTGHGTGGTIEAYQWTSSLDGAIGSAASFSTSSLSAGTHTITFRVRDTNDVISEAATASLVVAGIAAEDIIIDNTDSRTSRTGTWTASSASGSYGTGSVWSRDGATFTWKFTPTQTGNYNVSMWWTTTPSRSSSIPVQINNGNGSQTVAVNQLQNAGQWNSLGTFSFVAGATYNIIMTSQPSPTSTCADAMKFTMVSSGPTAVIDSITPNPTNLGQTVTFTGHGTGGTIEAYQWTSSLDGAIGSAASFSTSSLSAGTHTITFRVRDTNDVISEAATASLVVAGIAAEDIIIDNTDSRTSRTGTWTASSASGSYGTGSVWSRDGATFTWKFTPTQTGNYNVSMWWTTTSTRSASIPVTISYAGGSEVININQLQNESKWNALGVYPFNAGTTYNITITSQPAPTSTCADAVRFQTATATALVADFEGDHLTGNAPLTVQFTDLSRGQATSWNWNFGDGSTSTLRNPGHTYTTTGKFTVSLTVSGPSGSDTKTLSQYIDTTMTGSDVEHIYAFSGYSKDAAFVPNVKYNLKQLGATDAGDTWYYTNTSTGKSFAIHFVNTTEGFISSLKQPNAHIIFNGHSNYGLGGSFAQLDELYVQEIDAIKYIDDDRFTHISTPMVSVKIDGVQYGQAYPNWLPKFKNGTNGIMPYTFAEGTPPYNYYLTYKVPGDSTLYKIELADGSYLERFPDSGVPAWFSSSGLAPSPSKNPEYFIVNDDTDYNRCDFVGTWTIGEEEEDLREYNAYNYQYHAAGTGSNTATWTLVVRYAGYYQVTATWQSASTNASNAGYSIEHDGGTTTVVVDQRVRTDGYVLGTFYFSPGSYKVRLADNANGRVVADSIRLSYASGLADRLQAEFSAAVRTGLAPLTVAFTDLSEMFSSTGDTIASWFWDFGDGTTSASRNPTHVYSQAGIYTVALTVTSGTGARDTEVKTGVIRVGSAGTLRALFAANARNVTTRTTVQFTDMSSGSATSWLWDFGDGSTSTDQNPTHRFRTAGTYTVSLTVRSSSGTDTMTNTGYIQSAAATYTLIADNAYHYKPHFFDRSGSYGKTILYGNTGISESELKYSRMFYGSCNSCNYFAGNFHRGILYCTTSDSDMLTAASYIQYYLMGMSDDALVRLLNAQQDIHEMINFNVKPPSLR